MSENNQATTSPQAPAARFGGKGLNIGIAVAAVATVAGIALWVVQLSGGLVQTNMRNFDSWGLYITMFMFLVGLSAGGLIISSVPRAFGMQGFGGISKVAVWTSICCTVLAIGFVVVDLGQPMRLWELFAYSNLGSPLMWDIIVLAVYLILSIVFLWTLLGAEKGKASEKSVRIVAVVALVWALLVCAVDAWIFSLMPGRPMWNTALLAPWFISSALASGTALVLVAAVALRKSGYVQLAQESFVKLVKTMGVFICVDLFFFACDLITEGFPASSQIVAMLTTGPLAPFFWTEVVGSVVAALVCFVPKLRTNPLAVAAGLLVILGIFCKRIQLVVGGFQVPALDYATFLTDFTVTGPWGQGLAGAYAGMIYTPTLPEMGLALGVVALGVLLVLLGLRLLPLATAKDSL